MRQMPSSAAKDALSVQEFACGLQEGLQIYGAARSVAGADMLSGKLLNIFFSLADICAFAPSSYVISGNALAGREPAGIQMIPARRWTSSLPSFLFFRAE